MAYFNSLMPLVGILVPSYSFWSSMVYWSWVFKNIPSCLISCYDPTYMIHYTRFNFMRHSIAMLLEILTLLNFIYCLKFKTKVAQAGQGHKKWSLLGATEHLVPTAMYDQNKYLVRHSKLLIQLETHRRLIPAQRNLAHTGLQWDPIFRSLLSYSETGLFSSTRAHSIEQWHVAGSLSEDQWRLKRQD